MEHLFTSDNDEIDAHVVFPRRAPGMAVPGLVLAHGFPSLQHRARNTVATLPELAERISTEMGWAVVTFSFRGCGESQGNFSLDGWLLDFQNAISYLRGIEGVRRIWTSGFGTGGALAICAAAMDQRIQGAAGISTPADFDDWASNPRRLLQHCREINIIKTSEYPHSFDQWSKALKKLQAMQYAAKFTNESLLLIHGSEDNVVPISDAQQIADAYSNTELRIIEGGGHELRHDPRAIAVFLGWLDRQRNMMH